MIEDLIKRYKEFKRKEGHSDEFYKYEAIQHFQQNWNINAEDFAGMLRGLYESIQLRILFLIPIFHFRKLPIA